jgi:exosortase A-associated hydrolase 1
VIAGWPAPDGEEYALVFDRGRERRVLILPALFDEANKLRHFTGEVMRRLDEAGIDAFLPDLPGCNESRAPLEAQTLTGWRRAAELAARHFGATHALTVRGGCLCAPELSTWRYAPATGASILRAMLRARVIASKEAGIEETRDGLLEAGRKSGLELAGYRLGAAMIGELETAEPSGGAALANIAQSDLGGAGLWLRAEPDHDPAQAEALARIVTGVGERPSTSSGRAELGSIPTAAHGELVEAPARPRRNLTFACEGETLVGTLDEAPGQAGLLLVSGGNEIRAGAFAGQAQLAARIAAAGFPVFRYDRRGIGDSTGEKRGFRDSGPDIAAAVAAFKAERPDLARIVGFGNCDAASALMLNAGAGCDALVLANPWTIEHDDGAPPPAAIRARYAEKLRNPKELVRLATGKVSLRKLAGGLGKALRPTAPPTTLAQELQAGLERFAGPVSLLIAERDRTGQAFLAAWNASDERLERCPGASHAFVEPASRNWLFERLSAALSG